LEGSFTRYQVRVSAAIFDHDAQLLVVQHRRHGRTFWTFPGGSPNLGESLLHALIREVLEETGYTVEHGDIIALAELGDSRWESPRLEVIFRATVNQVVVPEPRSEDQRLNAQWRSLSDVEHEFLPARVLAAAIDGRVGRYLGNITETTGLDYNEDRA